MELLGISDTDQISIFEWHTSSHAQEKTSIYIYIYMSFQPPTRTPPSLPDLFCKDLTSAVPST